MNETNSKQAGVNFPTKPIEVHQLAQIPRELPGKNQPTEST
ncbi:MAG: hypothetical protein JWQ62_1548 [Lacunisphaera sp.]|nr:hypothetical protein [Lacunisphaera sp.]